MTSTNSLFDKLEGSKLTQVCFVHDYIQLVFQDNGGSIYNPLTVIQKNQFLKKGDLGYADSLVDHIGLKIIKVRYSEEEVVVFSFENGTGFSVSLRPEDYSECPEAVSFEIDKDLIKASMGINEIKNLSFKIKSILWHGVC